MKIKDGFVMRRVGAQAMVVATGEASLQFHGMVKLNATGADIWTWIEQGCDEAAIVQALVDKYDVDEARATAALERFLSQMRAEGLVSDD